ncbi:dnaJ homolog subfamily C member 8-like [Symsagittifera roscoffensis]|uniref:dnaJ homolog subfamily C member 8-like n=1 Tax=Symsagittifera roscoffensis TaxID=84072 RepID=UPI00307B417A
MTDPAGASSSDSLVQEFLKEIGQSEAKDSRQLKSEQEIHRLTRTGSSYFNLNPFEVLNVDVETPMETIRSRYKRLSVVVHPDKNMNDRERAQKAFDAIKKALEQLENEDVRTGCIQLINDCKEKVTTEMEAHRRKLKKEGKPPNVPEDDPSVFKEKVRKECLKAFADTELRKRKAEDLHSKEQKRQSVEEQKETETAKKQKEWNEKWEKGRDTRFDSWNSFKSQGVKKTKKAKGIFKPPKVRAEQR